jgi:hypothetical protein
MKNKIVVIVIAVLVGAGLFFGGMKLGQAQTGMRAGNRMFGNGQTTFRNGTGFGGQGGMRGAGFIAGEILSKDNKSITVKLQDGGSKIVFTSASTTVLKASQGTLGDLSAGTNVTVQGTANADGSLTAQSVQIRPNGTFGPGMRTMPAMQQ